MWQKLGSSRFVTTIVRRSGVGRRYAVAVVRMGLQDQAHSSLPGRRETSEPRQLTTRQPLRTQYSEVVETTLMGRRQGRPEQVDLFVTGARQGEAT